MVWVQTHISAFGGNGDDITIFGARSAPPSQCPPRSFSKSPIHEHCQPLCSNPSLCCCTVPLSLLRRRRRRRR